MKKQYRLHFSNSSNSTYTATPFFGTEIEMLKFASKFLNNKENKVYNLWIYDSEQGGLPLYMKKAIGGRFTRGKKIEKLIKQLEIQ